LGLSPFGNKRGDRFEEFVGTAAFRTDRGDTIQLTSSADPSQPPGISVLCKMTQDLPFAFLIEENHGVVCDLVGAERKTFKPAFVRTTTKTFIEAALEKNDGGGQPLPAVGQAAISHSALFQALSLATGRDVFSIT
jgi:hypothetical protein